MDNLTVLETRFNRILANKTNAEEQMILIEMREKDGDDVTEAKDKIQGVLDRAETSLKNTMEAVEQLKAKREEAATEE
jgi:hypothetical protein